MKKAVLVLSNNNTGELRNIEGKNDQDLYEAAHPIVHEFFEKHNKARCEMYEEEFQVREWRKPNPRKFNLN